MTNPFDSLGKSTPKEEPYDEWGGAFTCQTPGCWQVVNRARYYPSANLLVWKCPDGHKSKMEDAE